MIATQITIDADVLDALSDAIANAPRQFRIEFDRAVKSAEGSLLAELRKPPPKPRYPLRWKSDKQRRAFFATNGFGKGIPYKRTNKLVNAWELAPQININGGAIYLTNNLPYARFVVGEDQQPFHRDTGWTDTARLVARVQNKLVDTVIDAWYKAITE